MDMHSLNPPIKVLVTGANGNIAYSLIPHVLSGAAFGDKQPIILHLLSRGSDDLCGLVMELEDCIFPLHKGTVATSDIHTAFLDVDFVIFLASFPRNKAKRRHCLLEHNVKIMKQHGLALERFAKPSVKCLVVTNPCNTMLYVCRQSARRLPNSAFTCLTQVDHNRTVSQIKRRFGLNEVSLKNIIVLGNHSESVTIDTSKVTVSKPGVNNSDRHLNMSDRESWDVQLAVQHRGMEILSKTGRTSVLSITAAIIDHIRTWWNVTGCDDKGERVTMGVVSHGQYGIPPGLISSFPVTISNDGKFSIVEDIELSNESLHSLKLSIKELLEEHQMAIDIMEQDRQSAAHSIEMSLL